MKRILLTFSAGILPALVLALSIQPSRAGSATWKLNPTSSDWNTTRNWMPQTVPNSSSDIATFQSSNSAAVTLSSDIEVNGLVFDAGASAFTITAGPAGRSLVLTGTGITNNSDSGQGFLVSGDEVLGPGAIIFSNGATAGQLTTFTTTHFGQVYFSLGATADHGAFTNNVAGITLFADATAGQGTFINNEGSEILYDNGTVFFFGSSTAGDASITNNAASTAARLGGLTEFLDSSTAGDATLVNNGGTTSGAAGGTTNFNGYSNAGNATLIANGGSGGGMGGVILFAAFATGGTPRVEVFGNGSLDISGAASLVGGPASVEIGSLEGDGPVFLGANNMVVGGSNLVTTYPGIIQDGGIFGGIGGSLRTIGGGALTVTGANRYTGGTTVEFSYLFVNNKAGSGTGGGPVQVTGGVLGGKGKIRGSVRIGNGHAFGGTLAPGVDGVGRLVIRNRLTFESDGQYFCELDLRRGTADQVVAKGVTVDNAGLALGGVGLGRLPMGTVFIVINNTSSDPINGIFSGVFEGTIFTVGDNNISVSYVGGDGNDLTLTVVR